MFDPVAGATGLDARELVGLKPRTLIDTVPSQIPFNPAAPAAGILASPQAGAPAEKNGAGWGLGAQLGHYPLFEWQAALSAILWLGPGGPEDDALG